MRLPTEARPAIAHWKAPLVLCVMIFCLLAGLAQLGFAQTPLTLAGPTLSAMKQAKGSLETLINLDRRNRRFSGKDAEYWRGLE